MSCSNDTRVAVPRRSVSPSPSTSTVTGRPSREYDSASSGLPVRVRTVNRAYSPSTETCQTFVVTYHAPSGGGTTGSPANTVSFPTLSSQRSWTRFVASSTPRSTTRRTRSWATRSTADRVRLTGPSSTRVENWSSGTSDHTSSVTWKATRRRVASSSRVRSSCSSRRATVAATARAADPFDTASARSAVVFHRPNAVATALLACRPSIAVAASATTPTSAGWLRPKFA